MPTCSCWDQDWDQLIRGARYFQRYVTYTGPKLTLFLNWVICQFLTSSYKCGSSEQWVPEGDLDKWPLVDTFYSVPSVSSYMHLYPVLY